MASNEPMDPPPPPMDPRDRELLVEAAASAWRPRSPAASSGGLPMHPAWYDLDDEGREQAFEVARVSRAMEAALHDSGQSTTVRAVLARIAAAGIR